VPELTEGGNSWPYTALGVGFSLLGSFFVLYAFRRHRAVERAVNDGVYVAPAEWIVAGLSIAGALVGVVLSVILLVQE
jgi:hypothetical protein